MFTHNTIVHVEVPKEMLDSSFYIVNRDFDSFSKKWFETEIEFPSTSVVDTTDDRSNSPSSPPSLTSSYKNGHPYYMGFEQHDETYGMGELMRSNIQLVGKSENKSVLTYNFTPLIWKLEPERVPLFKFTCMIQTVSFNPPSFLVKPSLDPAAWDRG